MAPWVRNLVMLAVLIVWAIYIIGSLALKQNIPEMVWGVPPAAYVVIRKKNEEKDLE